jgi:hypothetical protein
MRSEVLSSVKIPLIVSPSCRHDPSAGCADAWAPSPKNCSSSFGECPPSLPPSPPASDEEEGFDLFDPSGALADTVLRSELPPRFSGPPEPLPYSAPDDSVLSPDEDEGDTPNRTVDVPGPSTAPPPVQRVASIFSHGAPPPRTAPPALASARQYSPWVDGPQ